MNERIRELRKQQGLTQPKFAELLHIAPNYVYLVESGKSPVTEKLIFNILNVFNVNEEWLRFGIGEMFAPKSREEEIADFAREILEGDESYFKYQLIKLLQGMSPEMLAYLREWVENYADELNNKK